MTQTDDAPTLSLVPTWLQLTLAGTFLLVGLSLLDSWWRDHH